jgi:small subunit ribosomal protein S1
VSEEAEKAQVVEESNAPEPAEPIYPGSAETGSVVPDSDGESGVAVERAEDVPAVRKKKPADAPKRRRKPPFPALMRAFRTRLPVEGTIEKVIKGGYEVKVEKARGFCPHSQISLIRENDPESHVGKTYEFRIAQLRRGGEDLVLSRRALLEERRTEEAKAVRATLIEGAVMQGHVTGAAAFGAFIDLGAGVEGLVHISELSHKRVNRVDEAVSVGDTVQVKVLKVDDKSGRLSLSIRAAQADPWAGIEDQFPVGSVHPGKVVRVAEFGAFVELAPGLEALAPGSEFPPSPRGWKADLEPGTTGDWQVLSVNPRERRLSITLPGDSSEPVELSVDATLEGKVQRVEGYGVFVWLGPGKVGLMPRVWTGTPPGTELPRRFEIGSSVEVTVVEIAEDGRRIRLCKKGVERESQSSPREPKPEAYEPAKRDEPETPFGNSLADKLRAALGGSDG